MSKADEEDRAFMEWRNGRLPKFGSPFERRGLSMQTMFDVLTLAVWTTIGAIALMVIGAPFMFLWFLVVFH